MGDLRDEQSSKLHVLKAPSPVLDASCVAALAMQLDTLGPGAKALDFSPITGHTAQGWSALIELLSRHPRERIALCGLSRSLVLSAIDLSLAELCTIHADVGALELAHREREA